MSRTDYMRLHMERCADENQKTDDMQQEAIEVGTLGQSWTNTNDVRMLIEL